MSSQATPIQVTEDGRTLGTIIHVAEACGVPRQTAWMWQDRRATTGFPDPDPNYHGAPRHPDAPLFDLAEVAIWYGMFAPGGDGRSRRAARPHVTADGRRQGSLKVVADTLGVPPRRLYKWADRRATTGFPDPDPDSGLYDLGECSRWHFARQHNAAA